VLPWYESPDSRTILLIEQPRALVGRDRLHVNTEANMISRRSAHCQQELHRGQSVCSKAAESCGGYIGPLLSRQGEHHSGLGNAPQECGLGVPLDGLRAPQRHRCFIVTLSCWSVFPRARRHPRAFSRCGGPGHLESCNRKCRRGVRGGAMAT